MPFVCPCKAILGHASVFGRTDSKLSSASPISSTYKSVLDESGCSEARASVMQLHPRRKHAHGGVALAAASARPAPSSPFQPGQSPDKEAEFAQRRGSFASCAHPVHTLASAHGETYGSRGREVGGRRAVGRRGCPIWAAGRGDSRERPYERIKCQKCVLGDAKTTRGRNRVREFVCSMTPALGTR
jgi:hypothetical protein